ncbi:hypothetical protein Patl1_09694 [Pistacia atlantica]|uniref:Uncharacterized protein n=1 Tax=Pistacia atlantica TaxID=434234 RepID=A0ACC1A601_9ROSI|nr:hypothetical protein Patl1_09694 [Pistacia atlantica]
MASANFLQESLLLSLSNLSLSGHGSSTSRTHQPSPMPPTHCDSFLFTKMSLFLVLIWSATYEDEIYLAPSKCLD